MAQSQRKVLNWTMAGSRVIDPMRQKSTCYARDEAIGLSLTYVEVKLGQSAQELCFSRTEGGMAAGDFHSSTQLPGPPTIIGIGLPGRPVRQSTGGCSPQGKALPDN